jgi:hypothetical protein
MSEGPLFGVVVFVKMIFWKQLKFCNLKGMQLLKGPDQIYRSELTVWLQRLDLGKIYRSNQIYIHDQTNKMKCLWYQKDLPIF